MSIKKTLFGTTKDNEQVYMYTLDNEKGLSAEILNLGGIIRSLIVTGADGTKTDVVLGHEDLEGYVTKSGYFGALVGRHANRIKEGRFTIGQNSYTVGTNEGKNSLHGGFVGFDKKVWEVKEHDGAEPAIELSLVSPDGDEGFPGKLDVTVVYTITEDNAIRIEYKAKSDKDTVLNMTNHSYFNLSGHDSGNIGDQILQLNSAFYTPNDNECMPTGEVLSVTGTPFDFRAPKPFAQDIDADFDQLKTFSGFDHNFVISGRGKRLFAVASSPKTGITMEVISDQSGVQLYTANKLREGTYKGGAAYGARNAFCLETQCFPNAMEHSHFPCPILKKDEEYNTVTEYKFTVK
ncbi:MAG: galactose mutarotase [Clostridiales bacterium]|nr:galactose mutarotase [Clostridiales bacterium]